jgi:histone-lysine N-methyltransferase ASH1L
LKKPEVVSSSVYLPRCSDISEDEIDEGKPKSDSNKVQLQPEPASSPPLLQSEVLKSKKNQKKVPKNNSQQKVEVEEKSLTKRQKVLAASTKETVEVEEESSKIQNDPKIVESAELVVAQSVAVPKLVVPKILKVIPTIVSKEVSSVVKTQKCSVMVEKLTDNFVSKSKKEDSSKNIQKVELKTPELPPAVKNIEEELVTMTPSKKLDLQNKSGESVAVSNTIEEVDNSEKEKAVETLPTTSEKVPIDKLKKRKRKANRTGFPTAKKKKKVVSSSTSSESKPAKPLSRPPSVLEPVRASSRLTLTQETEQQQQQPALDVAVTTLEVQNVVKGKRGRPAKDPEVKHSAAKRSRIYEDADDEVDCLGVLPVAESSGPSSETQSSAETDDVIGESSENSKKRKKKKHKLSPFQSPYKKNYLVAGLFSEFYKTTITPGNGGDGSTSKKPLSYNVNEHVHGLLPPPYYCGRQLRQKKEDFQLPYDLWWLQAHKQLPGRDVAATWNYKRIKNNVFFDVKPLANFEAQACHCRYDNTAAGCGDDCINRMTYSECDPRLCPIGDRCTNNQIQKHRGVTGLERFMTDEKGWGVRSKVRIQNGEFVMEYVGEVVSENEFKLRMLTEYVDDTHHYCLHLDGGAVIDGHRMGGECRFVNHSCRPNCEMQKWTVNGFYRMALFTLRDIEPGEELTYDYNFSLFNPHEGQICRCGAADCRGVIGGRSQRINGLLGKVESKSESKQSGSQTVATSTSSGSGTENRGRDRKKISTVRRSEGSTPTRALQLLAQVKPMSHQQRCFAQEHRCFLLRNLEKVRRVREKIQRKMTGNGSSGNDEAAVTAALRPEQMILTGLTALATARSMQTRRLAIAQDDPNVTKVVKLAQMLREIFAQVTSLNGKIFKLVLKIF